LTREAWKSKRDQIEKLTPGVEERAFLFVYRRSDYERAYGTTYRKPGVLTRILSFLYRLVPKIGPLKPLRIQPLTRQSEQLFEESVAHARERYHDGLQQVRDGALTLSNTNFDTGKLARHGDYPLADETYAELVKRLASRNTPSSEGLRRNLIAFYGSNPVPTGAQERKHWKETRRNLDVILGSQPVPRD
jgi:hypothetical protein